MQKAGNQLWQEHRNLQEHCRDLTTRLALAQRVETGNVEAVKAQLDALKHEQAAHLESVRIEYEGKLKEERKADEAEMKALQGQAEDWVSSQLKIASKKAECNLVQVCADLRATFAQEKQSLQRENDSLRDRAAKMESDIDK
ncbi:uncharacterized protein N7529_010387 [Penicillium soppii]|uniref:uncharacterized protein n=1 Tax=Penicillium soppii TaxID=69789 RepID=UPI00254992BF|nr:uncharacterized protein N7529_010387 [Penicillium soppii]KAJ5856443.1 hypothetical protein N7529_010387 [Penicillium soppii]